MLPPRSRLIHPGAFLNRSFRALQAAAPRTDICPTSHACLPHSASVLLRSEFVCGPFCIHVLWPKPVLRVQRRCSWTRARQPANGWGPRLLLQVCAHFLAHYVNKHARSTRVERPFGSRWYVSLLVALLLHARQYVERLSASSAPCPARCLLQLISRTPTWISRVAGSTAGSRKAALSSALSSNVGGLEGELESIVRRVLASRSDVATARRFGVGHVRGVLLSGPPGCGKTLLARELARSLGAREPQVPSVAGARWFWGQQSCEGKLGG
eukprot:302482-Pleurochrysis_carterae.AAC.1